jgi:hypothetical protein
MHYVRKAHYEQDHFEAEFAFALLAMRLLPDRHVGLLAAKRPESAFVFQHIYDPESVLSGYKSNSDNWLQQGLSELGVENVESA